MNILVTGANGQLGNEIRNLAVGSDNNWIFSDVTTQPGVETVMLDITDREQVHLLMTEHSIDCVINCAAYTNVEKAEECEEMAALLNVTAPGILAHAASKSGAFMIHVSTDYVLGGDSCLPSNETVPENPLGVYGKTKLMGEKAVVESGCHYLIFRTAWLYSPYGNNFVKTMRRLTKERDSLKVVFDQVGTPTSAADLAAAIFHIVENGLYNGRDGIYHYSNEGVCSWYDFAMQIAHLSGNTACSIDPCHSNEYPSKVRRPIFSVLDKSKFKQTFGLKVPYWIDSLEACVNRIETLEQNK